MTIFTVNWTIKQPKTEIWQFATKSNHSRTHRMFEQETHSSQSGTKSITDWRYKNCSTITGSLVYLNCSYKHGYEIERKLTTNISKSIPIKQFSMPSYSQNYSKQQKMNDKDEVFCGGRAETTFHDRLLIPCLFGNDMRPAIVTSSKMVMPNCPRPSATVREAR